MLVPTASKAELHALVARHYRGKLPHLSGCTFRGTDGQAGFHLCWLVGGSQFEALYHSFCGTFFLQVHEEVYGRRTGPVRVYFEHLDSKQLLADGLAKKFKGRIKA